MIPYRRGLWGASSACRGNALHSNKRCPGDRAIYANQIGTQNGKSHSKRAHVWICLVHPRPSMNYLNRPCRYALFFSHLHLHRPRPRITSLSNRTCLFPLAVSFLRRSLDLPRRQLLESQIITMCGIFGYCNYLKDKVGLFRVWSRAASLVVPAIVICLRI